MQFEDGSPIICHLQLGNANKIVNSNLEKKNHVLALKHSFATFALCNMGIMHLIDFVSS